MSQFKAFEGFTEYFIGNVDKFEGIYDSLKPHEDKLPGDWSEKLNSF